MSVKISKIHQRVQQSAARQKAIEENRFWDQLNDTHALNEARALAMLSQISAITGAFADPNNKVFQFITKPKELDTHVRAYLADVQHHLKRLDEIHQLHAHRKGGFVEASMNDDLRMHVDCIDQYKAACDVYDSVITPGINQIIEIYAAAELQMNQQGLFLATDDDLRKAKQEQPVIEAIPSTSVTI
jgi:hypothetical protein